MAPSMTPYLPLLLLVLCVLYAIKQLFFSKKRHPLPPGPKGLPLLGNIGDFPPEGELEYEFWLKHKDLYGPISSVSVLGQHLILIHDEKIAIELMEKRGNIHSSRPVMEFAGKIVGFKDMLGGLPYNDTLRRYRRYLHSVIGTKQSISRFNELQTAEVGRFLLRTLEDPSGLMRHIRKEAGAVILKLTYGYTIEPHQRDPLVDIADQVLSDFSAAAVPGAWLVDIFPALKYLPEWMPGAGFKATGRLWGQTLQDLVHVPYEFVKTQMAQHSNEPSFVSKMLTVIEDSREPTQAEKEAIKWSAAALYAGGADTTVASLGIFFLAMALFPEAQRKAQEELDRVVGTARLPTFEDRKNLPYIDAVVNETLRWHPIGPLSLAHMSDQDDVVGGYLIPKGALLIPNLWWFLHNPATYKDPAVFNPDRFLGAAPEPDPSVVFGLGRRICPGKLLADNTIFLSIAQSLAVFDISKARDPMTGKEVEVEAQFSPGLISHPIFPTPFNLAVKPRSKDAEALVRNIEHVHPWEESDRNKLGKLNQERNLNQGA